MDRTDQLLEAIAQVDQKLDAKHAHDEIRFKGLEDADAAMAHQLRGVLDAERENARMVAEQSKTLNALSQSVATATNYALEAKRDANTAVDESAKMVKQAIEIHGMSIALTVDATVQRVVEPMAKEVHRMKAHFTELAKNDETQNATLKSQDEKLDNILGVVTKLAGSRWLRVALVVGAFLGAALASYLASQLKSVPTVTAAPTPPPAALAPALSPSTR